MKTTRIVLFSAIPTFWVLAASLCWAQGSLKSELQEFRSKYVWNADSQRYILPNLADLEKIASNRYKNKQSVLRELADCMSDTSSSNVVLMEKSVSLGVVCYEALATLVYFEAPGDAIGAHAQWSGHIQPNASPKQLLEAKRQWLAIIRRHQYTNL